MLNFTVGPVMSSKEILDLGSQSSPYFRTPEFSALMKENEDYFLKFVNAPEKSRCVFLTSSGTGAMESVVMNILDDRDRCLVINGGSFGERFAQLCRLHGREFSEIRPGFGKAVRAEDLKAFDGKGYTALLVNLHETSSGTLYDLDLLAQFCKDNHMLFVIDAISSFIADELNMAEAGADVVITGSQKALAVPPGTAIVALSERALERVESHREVCMYLSLKEALKNGERGQTPFTPAVTTLLQIHRRFEQIDSTGIEAERRHIASLAQEIREVVRNLPLEPVSESMSNALTCLHPVKNNASDIVRIMKDDYGIWICPNGGSYSDTVFRIGHIGHITKEDNQTLIRALSDMNERGLL